ncbi:MAG: MBL fold metallo-hydrolase, partial [Oscillospiraceae bacterium]
MQITSLASGSGGNCTVLVQNEAVLLIDDGISMKRLKLALESLELCPEQISGILITHEHNDHISGLKTLIKHYEIPIFAPRTVANRLCGVIAGVEDYISELSPGREDNIEGFRVLPFRTPHDTPESVGYRITGDECFGFCTDCGHITDEVLEGLRGTDRAVIEANHDLEML